jgi:multiple sugar transport system permease protein
LLLHRSFRGRSLARAFVLIPWSLPPAIIAMAWRWIPMVSLVTFL